MDNANESGIGLKYVASLKIFNFAAKGGEGYNMKHTLI